MDPSFFWNPSKYFEVNAWNCFKTRFTKILRGKQESNQRNNNCEVPFNLAPNLELFSKDTSYSAILINRSIIHLDLPKTPLTSFLQIHLMEIPFSMVN